VAAGDIGKERVAVPGSAVIAMRFPGDPVHAFGPTAFVPLGSSAQILGKL